MTNEKLYTVTFFYTSQSTIYTHVHHTSKNDYVFTGYSGLKKALNCIRKYYIGQHGSDFFTVSCIRVSETLIFR
jgi:hypothetical protein